MHTHGIKLQLEKLRQIRAQPRRALEILRDVPPPPSPERDMTAAVGAEGGPASWRPEVDGAPVALHRRGWADSRWSWIYRPESRYATAAAPDPSFVAEANLRGRRGPMPAAVHGPFIHPPVWGWEVPAYFWFGGMAAGSTFIALGCDLAGDERSAKIARWVALGALAPAPPLLVMDLGRPERFYNMLRIFKLRSPMSTGSWCLSAFGGLLAGAIGADLLGKRRTAKTLGGLTAVTGTYLGSYTGVLLAATAVPVWGRSRGFLGPIFISTAALSGAAATKLTLAASGTAADDPTRVALTRVEDAAMAAELILSAINRRRLGGFGEILETGDGAVWFRRAELLGRIALVLRVVSRKLRVAEHGASVAFMGAALCYRFGWVKSGKSSAEDNEAVALDARAKAPGAKLEITDVKLDIMHDG